ncbi:MAG: response regulator transcription factor, partial [Bacteroidota bacterium]
LEKAVEEQFGLAVLDVMLPGIDGFEVARQLQKSRPDLPFVFLSARALKVDQLKGFRLGAADYITKPVDEELLVAKIRALLSRHQPAAATPISFNIGDYVFLSDQFLLTHPEGDQKLTARETALLHLFCRFQNQLMPRKMALRELWGGTDEFSRKSMDVFVSRLRKYLSKDPRIRIENIHGQGFVLRCETN